MVVASCDWLVLTVTCLWQTSLTGIVLCRWLHTLGRWEIGQCLCAKTGADDTHVQVVNIGMSYTSLSVGCLCLCIQCSILLSFLRVVSNGGFSSQTENPPGLSEKKILLCRLSR